MNTVFKNIYPRQQWSNENFCHNKPMPCNNDERFGGFLVPFIAGAAISAPFWLAAGNNRPQQTTYYPYPPQYPYYPVYVNSYPTTYK